VVFSNSELISESKDLFDISVGLLVWVIGPSKVQTKNQLLKFLTWLEHSWSVASSSE
jgi:hypothetical protein